MSGKPESTRNLWQARGSRGRLELATTLAGVTLDSGKPEAFAAKTKRRKTIFRVWFFSGHGHKHEQSHGSKYASNTTPSIRTSKARLTM